MAISALLQPIQDQSKGARSTTKHLVNIVCPDEISSIDLETINFLLRYIPSPKPHCLPASQHFRAYNSFACASIFNVSIILTPTCCTSFFLASTLLHCICIWYFSIHSFLFIRYLIKQHISHIFSQSASEI